jgi:hypothetical protein
MNTKNPNMKYAIISTKGVHEYDIQVIKTEHSTTYSMCYSQSEIWSEPGMHLQTITDDGNDIHLNVKIKKTIDYGTFAELSILFDFVKNHDTHLMEEYQTYKLIK